MSRQAGDGRIGDVFIIWNGEFWDAVITLSGTSAAAVASALLRHQWTLGGQLQRSWESKHQAVTTCLFIWKKSVWKHVCFWQMPSIEFQNTIKKEIFLVWMKQTDKTWEIFKCLCTKCTSRKAGILFWESLCMSGWWWHRHIPCIPPGPGLLMVLTHWRLSRLPPPHSRQCQASQASPSSDIDISITQSAPVTAF